jgi:two-component system response regulator FixJ
LEEIEPGCLVVDVRMPGTDGMQLLNQLHHNHPEIPLIMMSGHGDIPLAVKAIQAGALDFLEKPFSANTLINAIERCKNMRLQEQDKQESGQQIPPQQRRTREAISHLTPREREVLNLLVSGLQNKQIASELGISSRTVEVHRARLKHKLGVRTVTELVRLAMEAGGPSSGLLP